MKNYVAKLRENEEKGFSLVELIIVMAIMAILVGVVASQVIPYMEKSKLSKDQENLASLQMDISSAIATSGCTLNDGTFALSSLASAASQGGSDLESELCTLRGKNAIADVVSAIKFKSKKADGAAVYVKTDSQTGEITVFASKNNGTSAADAKLSVSSAGSSTSGSGNGN